MAYLQNNSAFIPNGLTRYLPHSNQCDEANCSLAKRFGDAESCAQCPIYYDQRPVHFADRTICGVVYRSVSLNDELPNLPPNSYGTLAKRKREKVYFRYCLRHGDLRSDRYTSFALPSTTFISVRSLCLGSIPGRRGLVGWRAPVLRCGAAWRIKPSRRVADRALLYLSLHYLSTTFLCRGSVSK